MGYSLGRGRSVRSVHASSFVDNASVGRECRFGLRCRSRPVRRSSLVIGAIGSVVDAGVPDDMRIETVEWPAWSLSVLVRRNIDLVVPVVEAFDAVTAAFFDVLSRTNTHAPVLAVLPAADIHSPQLRRRGQRSPTISW